MAGWEAETAEAEVVTCATLAVRGVGEPMDVPVLGVSLVARRLIAEGAGASEPLVEAIAAAGAAEAVLEEVTERCTVDDEASIFCWLLGDGVAFVATFGAALATSGREVVRG